MSKILVVDDQPCVQQLLTAELTLEGYHVASSGDVKSAKRRLSSFCPDVVLLDLYLDTLGLLSSLRELFDDMKQTMDIKIHFFTQNVPKHFDKEKELAIYRITQEPLNNITKHAAAQEGFVNLVQKDKSISLSVEDNGVGFEQNKAMEGQEQKGPLGFLIMQERVVQLGGEFRVESRYGHGTLVSVEIPI